MKKLLCILTICLALPAAVVFNGGVQAKAAPLDGSWSGEECYDGFACDSFLSSWTFTAVFTHPIIYIYTVNALRTSTGDTSSGFAIDLKPNGLVYGGLKHGCYGSSCGDCAYLFIGQVSGTSFSGTADYCDGGATGTFTHTKGGRNEEPTYSGGEANPN